MRSTFVLFLALLVGAPAFGYAPQSLKCTTFAANGTYTSGRKITIGLVCGRGGSGGGGGGQTTGTARGGMGGGGAGTVCFPVTLTPNTGYTVTLGPAGTAGTVGNPGSDGGDGGDTTFGSLLTFKGARGGRSGAGDPATGFNRWRYGRGVGVGGDGGNGGTPTENARDGMRSAFVSGGTSGGAATDGGGGGGGDGVGGNGGTTTGPVVPTDGTSGGGGGGCYAGEITGICGAGTLGWLQVCTSS